MMFQIQSYFVLMDSIYKKVVLIFIYLVYFGFMFCLIGIELCKIRLKSGSV